MKALKWFRVCQSCGNVQEDIAPQADEELTDAYRNRRCRKCKSADLDYGWYRAV